ncbi:glutathione peroxidase [Neptunicella marina]|uniref:Glutathione peroxidase n=1 Tax=Neptunicella marina TaxID=2125989 RepID=A0A8J6IS26_9ALTE|nr:glutathione peroxidase [Neptunicella marina]MBC3766420.1 glutathione peroxidase [Neptunicella marina]
MKKLVTLLAVLGFSSATLAECPDVLKFVKRKLNSQETVNLCDAYAGKTLLIVNTASYCGFTPQFKGLEALYAKYKDQGFSILGFPSHDFNQEDDDEGKTAELCKLTYGVKFPMFEPMSVKGEDADPMYRILAKQAGSEPSWNFYKYLVGADGKVIQAFGSRTKPQDEDFISVLEANLKKS